MNSPTHTKFFGSGGSGGVTYTKISGRGGVWTEEDRTRSDVEVMGQNVENLINHIGSLQKKIDRLEKDVSTLIENLKLERASEAEES